MNAQLRQQVAETLKRNRIAIRRAGDTARWIGITTAAADLRRDLLIARLAQQEGVFMKWWTRIRRHRRLREAVSPA